MTAQQDAVAAFHDLRSSGCFVMPNPWDAGNFTYFEGLPDVDGMLVRR